jgi:hypothetical protein
MSHASVRSIPNRELSLPEMLADPIVQIVMARDGVTKQDVEGLIGAMRAHVASGRMAEQESGRHKSSAINFEY